MYTKYMGSKNMVLLPMGWTAIVFLIIRLRYGKRKCRLDRLKLGVQFVPFAAVSACKPAEMRHPEGELRKHCP